MRKKGDANNIHEINKNQLEKLSKSFSFKLAEKLEKGEIGLDETQEKIHNFLMLAKEENIAEMEKFMNEI